MTIQTIGSEAVNCAPPLQAKAAGWMRALLKEKELLRQWLNDFGSPLHVVTKQDFLQNTECLLKPMRERKLDGGLFFARKANKLAFFVEAAKQAGIGVDTASLSELKETLALGLDPEKIILTAIGKTEAVLRAAMDTGCLIVVENEDELSMLKQLAASRNEAVKIGLRFSGFEIEKRTIYSRFGFKLKDHQAIIDGCKDCNLNVILLHAHIDRYDIAERAMAARQLIRVSEYAREAGNNCNSIDLGGGILMCYLEHEEQWRNFQDELIAAVKGERESFTFKGDGLGYYVAGGKLEGQADLYPAWNSLAKEKFIEAVLDHKTNGKALHQEITEAKLKLYFEPGRSLLDNCGMSLADLAFRKADTLNETLYGLRMNRMNLRPFRAEFCSDPILLSYGPRARANNGAYLVGCLCSESDTIFRRKFFFPERPEPGDVFVFLNSAGYLAHHMEIGTHGDPIPRNILIDPQSWQILGQS